MNLQQRKNKQRINKKFKIKKHDSCSNVLITFCLAYDTFGSPCKGLSPTPYQEDTFLKHFCFFFTSPSAGYDLNPSHFFL